MTDGSIDAHSTFVPWYGGFPLTLPPDASSCESRALREFGRMCRVERIKRHVAAYPSRSMFRWQDEQEVANG
jgi:hypothetical protein